MNYEDIVNHLCDLGYAAVLDETENSGHIDVTVIINDQHICFRHFCEKEVTGLPKFYILGPRAFGDLAHVTASQDGLLGGVCVGDNDSISVNYEQPALAFAESIKRHIDLIRKAITDTSWNEQELLREFYSNWLGICDSGTELICAANGGLEEINIYSPVQGHIWGFEAGYLGITESATSLADFSYIAGQGKGRHKVGIGFVIPLSNISPAPSLKSEIESWYLHTISENTIPNVYTQKKSRQFWLIFNTDTPSGRAWFGVKLSYHGKGKKALPITLERLKNWSIEPTRVTIFNKERLMPRSGADLSLEDKSVLIVGAGSVGGEIAYKLGAAGVGKLVISDPDVYSVDNIYRHVLHDRYLHANKAIAVCHSLHSKYPWINATRYTKHLLDLRDKNDLSRFDLIVIAIGSPTHERLFHDYLIANDIKVPVVNTWLEGYGIGGHATLDLPNSKGCLRCAYVDIQQGARGLSSNLNFLEPNQNLTVNHAGCGELFLPYNAISSAQTALIASNLAIGSLLGNITTSSKISWKGDDALVSDHGFTVTHRYTVFEKSLLVLPLYNDECDLCHE